MRVHIENVNRVTRSDMLDSFHTSDRLFIASVHEKTKLIGFVP